MEQNWGHFLAAKERKEHNRFEAMNAVEYGIARNGA